MNSYGFLLYIMGKRMHEMEQNEQAIYHLKQELDFDIEYQRCLEVLQKGKKKKSIIEKKLEQNEWHYKLDKEDRIILNYSNQIQMITEAISEKEQKIRFIQMMMHRLEQRKSVNYISLFIQFYHESRKTTFEELGEIVSFTRELITFHSTVRSIMKKQKKQLGNSFQERLTNLLTYYISIQDDLREEKERKQSKLQESVQFKRKYPKMQKKLQEDKNAIDVLLYQANQMMERIQAKRSYKQNEIIRLEQQNQTYQTEIENLREMFNSVDGITKTTMIHKNFKLQYRIGERKNARRNESYETRVC